MIVDQWLRDLAPMMVTFVGMVAWFIRLEAKGLANEKGLVDAFKLLDKLDVQVRALDNKIVEKLSFIERSLAKIEGRLSIDNESKHNA